MHVVSGARPCCEPTGGSYLVTGNYLVPLGSPSFLFSFVEVTLQNEAEVPDVQYDVSTNAAPKVDGANQPIEITVTLNDLGIIEDGNGKQKISSAVVHDDIEPGEARCLVCNDKSSGLHYGVLACEGCKVDCTIYLYNSSSTCVLLKSKSRPTSSSNGHCIIIGLYLSYRISSGFFSKSFAGDRGHFTSALLLYKKL